MSYPEQERYEATLLAAKEKDPSGLAAKAPGAKLDAGKAPIMQGVLHYFPRAIIAVANLSKKGADKYSWKGWEKVSDGPNRYGDALARHIVKEAIEGPYDQDFEGNEVLHATGDAWNALARLELILRDMEHWTPMERKLGAKQFKGAGTLEVREQMDPVDYNAGARRVR